MRPTLPERRSHTAPITWTVRNRGDGPPVVEGHAAVFNSPTLIAGSYRERIAPGAFRKVLREMPRPVPLVWNHDPGELLASTRNGTLELREDSRGLAIRAQLIGTSVGRDVALMLEEGLVDRMSFAFSIGRETWDDAARPPEVTIDEVKALYDVSIVTEPAYADAEVALASLRAARRPPRESPAAVRARVARALARHQPVEGDATVPATTTTAVRRHPAAATIVKERSPYGADSAHSWVRDKVALAGNGHDPAAQERLQRHEAAPRAERAITTGSFGTIAAAAIPPYVEEAIAMAVRSGAPLATALERLPLPPTGTVVAWTKVGPGSTVTNQSAENATLTVSTDPVAASATDGLGTIASYVDFSVQSEDRSGGWFDRLIAADIGAAFAARLEQQIWAGTGANQQLRGFTVMSGNSSSTVSGQTLALISNQIANQWQQVATNLGAQPDILAMHPRRAAQLDAATDALGLPLSNILPPGCELVVSPAAPTNLGGGTNEDWLLLLNRPSTPLVGCEPELQFQKEGPGAGPTLMFRALIYAYGALGVSRRPEGVGLVKGATPPVFA